MKRQIRRGVFETNSSSTHSISISKAPATIGKSIHFGIGEFGWSNDEADTADYLYTGILCQDDHKEYLDKLKDYLDKNNIQYSFEEPKWYENNEDKWLDEGFEEKQDLIKRLVDEKLVYGVGVSLVNPTDSFISLVKKYPNAVIHVINGILTESDVEKLADNNLKMLILGYKQLRRGNDYFSVNQKAIYQKHNWLVRNLPDIINRFNTVSFDNLAIEQLDVQRLLTKEEWDEFYMGDDGTMTYYIDMVEQKFAQSSTAPFEERYDLLDSVDEMFNVIVEGKCEK